MNSTDAVSVAVRAVPGGVELAVVCQPKAARTALVGLHGGQFKVKVRAAPVAGRANEELTDLLAGVLGVPRRDVTLVSGEQSRMKRVRVAGLAAGQAIRILEEHLAAGQIGLS